MLEAGTPVENFRQRLNRIHRDDYRRLLCEELLALDEALVRLEAINPRHVRIVECRFFGGLTIKETAEIMDLSVRTTERLWSRAKTYLYLTLRGDQTS
ncbi:MAG: hypothetical protein IH820_17105 [Bacteroidetes bacterium]|nr:hypothetical protein [Bacteroidota bacterium]